MIYFTSYFYYADINVNVILGKFMVVFVINVQTDFNFIC